MAKVDHKRTRPAIAEPPATAETVTLRVGTDESPRDVVLPARDFNKVTGASRRLEGPAVAVKYGPVIYRGPDAAQFDTTFQVMMGIKAVPPLAANGLPNAIADKHGNFTAKVADRTQTTAFVAAHEVHAWAERMLGYPVAWGKDGTLEINPAQWVSTSPEALNADYNMVTHKIQLGVYGALRNGRPVAFSGRDLSTLELGRSLIRERDTPERDKHLATLAHIERLLAGGKTKDAAQLITSELAHEPPLPAPDTSSWAAQVSPPQRDIYYGVLELTRGDLERHRPVHNAFFDMAQSPATVRHEGGHALLAMLKPALRDGADAAFHEFVGDHSAIAAPLDDPKMVRAMLRETGGDLTRSSSFSRICEREQQWLDATMLHPGSAKILRDASARATIDDFGGPTIRDATDPNQIPEAHRLSRLLSSATYALFAQRANAAIKGLRDVDAKVRRVQAVSDEVSTTVLDGMSYMPESGNSLSDIAGAWLVAARNQDARGTGGGHLEAQLRGILEDRGLVKPGDTPVPKAMRDVPSVRVDATWTALVLKREPTIATILASWATRMPERAIVPISDTTNAVGTRVVRYAFDVPGNSTVTLVAGALTFDANGTLVAASGG
jgi:hypothetical protein